MLRCDFYRDLDATDEVSDAVCHPFKMVSMEVNDLFISQMANKHYIGRHSYLDAVGFTVNTVIHVLTPLAPSTAT